MEPPADSKTRILMAAQRQFWARGYSAVSLRDITRAAGVDVALVARHYGSKLGLFTATLDLLPTLDTAGARDAESLVAILVEAFVAADRSGDTPSPTTCVLMNVQDPVVADLVRLRYRVHWQAPIEAALGDPAAALRLSAALLGTSLSEKALRLDGWADPADPAYAAQLAAFFRAAIAASPDGPAARV